MLIGGNVWGWSMIIVVQPLLSMVFMFWYLREIGLSKISGVAGGVVFAFSGFMMTYLEYATAGQIFIWLPLLLLFIEKYFKTRRVCYLIFLSLTFFMVITAGFFQPALYVGLVTLSYFFFKAWKSKDRVSDLLRGGVFFVFAGTIAAIQLIPTFELLKLSIRNLDHNIVEYNYGLLPLKNLVTFLIPDFFGNPATNNFWGYMGYQETSGYFGVVALILVILAIRETDKKFVHKFFIVTFFVSLILAFDNPLSRLIYVFNLPGIATGYASRWLLVTTFSAAVLAALGIDGTEFKRRHFQPALFLTIILILISVSLLAIAKNFINLPWLSANDLNQLHISLRNSLWPGLLLIVFILSTRLIKGPNYFLILVTFLLIADLLRYGTKFTPFSPLRLTHIDTPITDYLKKNIDYYRIEKEYNQPLLPANSWIYFRLMTPSGYDPLVVKNYASWYRVYNNETHDNNYHPDDLIKGWFTRYLDLNNYKSSVVDLAGVKYLLALKKDKLYKPDQAGKILNNNIPQEKFTQVFEDGAVVVLENQNVLPRVSLYYQWDIEPSPIRAQEIIYGGYDFKNRVVLSQKPEIITGEGNKSDTAKIISYTPNEVKISTKLTGKGAVLLLTDTYYPGWRVKINKEEKPIIIADGIYRAVEIPQGESEVTFFFWPQSFKLGLIISASSLLILLFLLARDLLKFRK